MKRIFYDFFIKRNQTKIKHTHTQHHCLWVFWGLREIWFGDSWNSTFLEYSWSVFLNSWGVDIFEFFRNHWNVKFLLISLKIFGISDFFKNHQRFLDLQCLFWLLQRSLQGKPYFAFFKNHIRNRISWKLQKNFRLKSPMNLEIYSFLWDRWNVKILWIYLEVEFLLRCLGHEIIEDSKPFM